MNLGIIILSIIGILFVVFWAWYKLSDTEEGDVIDMGFGTHVERWAYEARVVLALIICFLDLAGRIAHLARFSFFVARCY